MSFASWNLSKYDNYVNSSKEAIDNCLKSSVVCTSIIIIPLIYVQNVEVKNRMAKVDVELWDTSGNLRFDKCWPALAREAHGVMFVFHPGRKTFV